MPKVSWAKKPQQEELPEIDWLMAAILERKHRTKMTFDDLAAKVGCSGVKLKLMFSESPWSWSQEDRNKICEVFGISKEIRQKCYTGD